ncbi:MAG TPA: WD40 repeat domain-containing protein [Gemmataceae bacterium]|jgi:WD40 repeat protein
MRNRYLPLVLCVAGVLGAEPKRERYSDPLPEGAVARLGSLRLRHESFICAADFSPDSRTLAVVDGSGLVTFWDPVTARRVRRMTVSLPYQARSLRFCADGKSLILVSAGGAVRVVDAVSGATQRSFDPPQPNSYFSLPVARDGKVAVAVHLTGSLLVWDLVNGKRLREFKNRTAANLRSGDKIALTPDATHAVLPRQDGSLRLVDLMSGEEVLTFEMPRKQSDPPQTECPTVAISPNGRYLAYGGRFYATTLCDLKTGKRLREFAARPNHMDGLAFTPNSRFLAVSAFGDVRIFGTASGKEVRTFRKPRDAGDTLVFSPDGRMLGLMSNSCILLWDLVADRPLHAPVGHLHPIASLAFFPDGKRLVSSAYHEMIVWDITTARPVARRQSGLIPQSLSVIGDGEAVQFNEFQSVHRWDLGTGREEQQSFFQPPSGSKRYILSANGRRMAAVTLGRSPQVHFLDTKAARRAVSFALPDQGWVSQLLLSPDGRRLLLGTSDGSSRLLDGATGELVRDLTPSPPGCPASAAFAGDGRSIALFDEGRLSIREIAGGGTRLQIPATGKLSGLIYSPDGRFLAFSSSNGSDVSTLVFSTATGKQLGCWQGKQGTAPALAFSPDSRLLATGGMDGTILLWKIPENDGLPAMLSMEEAATLWQELTGDDTARANRALAGLAAAPAQAVPLIKQRFRTTWTKPDAKRLARLIADLDSDTFKVRERATRELSEAGSDAADALRQALANNPSTEAKRRLEDLINRLSKGGNPERLRSLRAIEVLERIGTPEAIDVLRELGRQSLPVELHEDIEASLQRLEKHRPAASRKLSTP